MYAFNLLEALWVKSNHDCDFFVFLGNHQCFKSDAGSYRKPIEGTQCWDDVGVLWEIENKLNIWILSPFQGFDATLEKSCQKQIAVPQSWDYTGLNKRLSVSARVKWPDPLDCCLCRSLGSVVKDLGYWLKGHEFKYSTKTIKLIELCPWVKLLTCLGLVVVHFEKHHHC